MWICTKIVLEWHENIFLWYACFNVCVPNMYVIWCLHLHWLSRVIISYNVCILCTLDIQNLLRWACMLVNPSPRDSVLNCWEAPSGFCFLSSPNHCSPHYPFSSLFLHNTLLTLGWFKKQTFTETGKHSKKSNSLKNRCPKVPQSFLTR